MRASVIRHPEGERLIMLREWQREACDGDNCAGFLLSFFEYWHNIKMASRQKAREANDVAEAHGDSRAQDEGINMWFTEAELEAGLLYEYGRKTIAKSLVLLESKGFVRSGPNPNPAYRFDRVKHFWLCPEVVNAWLAIHRPLRPETTTQFNSYDDVNLRDAQEVKLPRRKSNNASPSGKNAAPSRKNASAIPEITSKNTDGEDNGEQAPPPPGSDDSSLWGGSDDVESIQDVTELPDYLACPKTSTPDIWLTLLKVCKVPLAFKPTKNQKIALNDVAGTLTRGNRTGKDLRIFEARWYQDWRGRDGAPPTPRQIRENWAQIMCKKEVSSNGSNGNPGVNGAQELLRRQQLRRDGAGH